ncbi:uncharacterized protein LOC124638220 isoform X1 [Helicoverpa zea]|uniref:uncharacterized protein LOC124638220 isoform X1 n=1 Tax=Helicoverpa zea TaxID=7113 RepID=UPI001F56487A|nr:uncharacterized protein LOC124638220 isoform X1 [Helicoverpa zea]
MSACPRRAARRAARQAARRVARRACERSIRLADCDKNHRKKNNNHNLKVEVLVQMSFSCSNVIVIYFVWITHTMPKIPNLRAFGKHCHNCGKWMERRALRKDVTCNFCNGKIFARDGKQKQMCSRCVECDNIILDNFNYCECCGCKMKNNTYYQIEMSITKS